MLQTYTIISNLKVKRHFNLSFDFYYIYNYHAKNKFPIYAIHVSYYVYSSCLFLLITRYVHFVVLKIVILWKMTKSKYSSFIAGRYHSNHKLSGLIYSVNFNHGIPFYPMYIHTSYELEWDNNHLMV